MIRNGSIKYRVGQPQREWSAARRIGADDIKAEVKRFWSVFCAKSADELAQFYSHEASVFSSSGERSEPGRVSAIRRRREYCHAEPTFKLGLDRLKFCRWTATERLRVTPSASTQQTWRESLALLLPNPSNMDGQRRFSCRIRRVASASFTSISQLQPALNVANSNNRIDLSHHHASHRSLTAIP